MKEYEDIMNKIKHFNPGVMIDGDRIEVEGWMVILAFAIRGIPWALEQADDPEYDLRGKMNDYNRRRSIYFTEGHIVQLENKLKKAKEELCELNK